MQRYLIWQEGFGDKSLKEMAEVMVSPDHLTCGTLKHFPRALASVSVIFKGQTIKYRYGHKNKVENNFEALIITQNGNCT